MRSRTLVWLAASAVCLAGGMVAHLTVRRIFPGFPDVDAAREMLAFSALLGLPLAMAAAVRLARSAKRRSIGLLRGGLIGALYIGAALAAVYAAILTVPLPFPPSLLVETMPVPGTSSIAELYDQRVPCSYIVYLREPGATQREIKRVDLADCTWSKRHHAHLVWDYAANAMLVVDEQGVPPPEAPPWSLSPPRP